MDLPALDSGQFTHMKPYNMRPLVSGLFHFAYFKGPSVLRYVSGLHSFLRLNNFPPYGRSTFGFSICQVENMRVLRTVGAIVNMLLRTSVHKLLRGCLFAALPSIH